MLRTIEEEIGILQYKESIKNDPIAKQEYENEIAKPLPKMKVWQVPPKEEVKSCMCPTELRKDIVAQVWQENANKPTMTLEEVGDLEYNNMMEREARQAKFREENKEDTDSDKEEVDERMKKKDRAWDDWKDEHEKGAGNRNGR
jgi:phosphopantothenoylcysteine synthetase/decarboxylase